MKEIKLKGKITPLTPKGAYRIVNSEEDVPKEFDACLETKNFDGGDAGWLCFIINGRKCKVRCTKYDSPVWVGDGDTSSGDQPSKNETTKIYYIVPVDDPSPPTKLRVTEHRADLVFFKFCRTRDWQQLFNDYERSQSEYYRNRLLKHLNEFNHNKDCGSCELRFMCYTEK